jgi:AraC-like DNA-binding protein
MTYLLFGGGLYMVLMGVVWLIQDPRNDFNRYFAALYSSTGLIVLYAWAERTRIIYQAYPLYNMQIPLCYFSAPLLFYGFSQITDLKRKPAEFYWPHFIPAMAAAPLVLVTNLLNAPIFAALPANVIPADLRVYPAFFVIHLLGLGSNVYILLFLTRIIINGVRFFRDTDLETIKELRLLLLFVGMYYVDILLMMIAHLAQSLDMLHLAKFLSSATLILYSFYSFRYPEYTQKVIRKTKQLRYKNTQIRGLDAEAVMERLAYLMEREKAFRDMELSLATLSSQLMVTPHQLSEILNERLQMNFTAFLNGHRVREAQGLLVERPELTILEIAFDVGFNSKAAFNGNFLRQAGMSPSEYRKKYSSPGAREPASADLGSGPARQGPLEHTFTSKKTK